MRQTTLDRFDDNELTLLFATVGELGKELTRDCGSYEKAIMYRQMAYMWRTAAEKDYLQREKDYQSLLSTKDKKIPRWVRMMSGDAEGDLIATAGQQLISRRKMLDAAKKVMIKNKPPHSSLLVFCSSKFQFDTSISDVLKLAQENVELFDKDSEIYKVLFPSFDD